MSSMNNNNWLGFSLSPQNHSDEISGAQVSSDQCFDLTSDSTLVPSPVPFQILEAAFNTNTQAQDWRNMQDASINSFSCSSIENQERPKLEMFLGVGGQSFSTHHHHQEHKNNLQDNSNPNIIAPFSTNYYNPNDHHNTYNMYQQTDNTSSIIGLSMIKNWLRNNPVQPHMEGEKVDAEVAPLQSHETLSLSMNGNNNAVESCTSDSTKVHQNAVESTQTDQSGVVETTLPKKSIETFGQRTSIYRGVTRHRWTGRYEAHLWDNSCRREGQTRKGRQVYLGGYDKEEKAARAYDLTALKYWGNATTTNFPISKYEKELEEMKHMTRQEYIASLRRKSSGFSRGASKYRGVTRHHQHGRWQARIGRVAGNKDLYLGTFTTQEEAAEAYDIAAIKFRGLNAVTNFEINRYDVKSIMESSTLPIGGAAKRLKDAENAERALDMHLANEGNLNLNLKDGHINGYGGGSYHSWPTIAFHQAQSLSNMYPYAYQCKQEQDTDVYHGFSDVHRHLQLRNEENLLQHSSVLQNFMSLDSCSSGSDSVIYGNNGTVDGNGSNRSFVMPMMGNVNVQDGNQNLQGNGYVGDNNEDRSLGYEGRFGSIDGYQQARNLYFQSSPNGIAKDSPYNQGSTWFPTGVPMVASSDSNMALCNGSSTFTVWNDT